MKITYPKEKIPGIFTVKLSGETSIFDIFKLLKTSIKILTGKKHDKVLLDITDEKNKFNMMETLEIVEHYPAMLRKYKIAVLDLPKNIEKIKMHEKMAVKRGFRVFGFTDKDEAVNWLLGDTHNEILPRRDLNT